MTSIVKAVLFDIDNTLYDYDSADAQAKEAVYAYCWQKFGWKAEETKRYQEEARTQIEHHIKDVSGRDTAVLHNRLIRFQKMLENNHLPLMPHAISLYNVYWDTLISSMEVSGELVDYIKYLKENGIKIGIATDMTAHIQFRKLEKLSLLSFVDFVVTSEEAGCEKPEKAFYELCIEKAGFLPEECLMIGDSLQKDVSGARAAGMQALHYRKGIINDHYRIKKDGV